MLYTIPLALMIRTTLTLPRSPNICISHPPNLFAIIEIYVSEEAYEG